MNYVQTFLSQELTQALGWTLLHSLWQGALVALALSVMLVFMNRHSAQVRYFISVTALFTTLTLAVFTFFSLYREPAKITGAVFANGTFAGENPIISAVSQAPENWFSALPLSGFFTSYFEKHLPLIVAIWFMGLLVMALKMLGGLAYVQRLKHYQAKPLSPSWQHKLAELQTKLNFKKPVALLESMQVKVPVAIGYLKPVILVPVGAVNGLSEKQVEAILAHELAHIFRHDYLFNLLQSVVETLFFYHPAMWWISASVRAERENCCDDIALDLCGDSIAFAGALAELEEMNFAAGPALAMAYNGKRGSLLGRIKRLLHQPRRSASFSEGFIAACILMMSISAISLSAMAQLKPEFEEFPFYVGSIAPEKPKAAPETKKPLMNDQASFHTEQTEACTIPTAPEFSSDFEAKGYTLSVSVAPDGDDGEDIIIVKDKKGKITELYVNGKKVRKNDMPEFQRIIDERGTFGRKNKKKSKEYASKEDVKEARKALKNLPDMHAFPAPHSQVYVLSTPEVNTRFRYRYNTPAPPMPPAIEIAPMAALAPIRPMRPMKPIAPLAPMGEASVEEKKEFEAERKEYEQELKEYEIEMKDFAENNGKEWKEYEQELEEYREEMAEYGKEMAEYGRDLAENIKSKTHVYVNVPDQKEITRIREEAARAREWAAKDRAKAIEAGAKARAAVAEERAKERAKAAEARAKAAKERNARMEKLKAELRKDQLIGEKNKSLSYRISNDGLYVNGKKQPDATFEKYKKLFHPGFEKGGKYNEVYNITED